MFFLYKYFVSIIKIIINTTHFKNKIKSILTAGNKIKDKIKDWYVSFI